MARQGEGGGGRADDPFGRALERVIAEAASAEAARERVTERTLRTVAEAEATFLGVALDLAEQASPVVVRAGGRNHRGRIVAVGRDVLVLREEDRPSTIVAAPAVTSIRPHLDAAPVREGDTAGRRPAPLDVGMASLLARVAPERPRVVVGTMGEEPLAGVLRSVGLDVVTLRLDGDRRPVVHLRLDAVTDVVLLDP